MSNLLVHPVGWNWAFGKNGLDAPETMPAGSCVSVGDGRFETLANFPTARQSTFNRGQYFDWITIKIGDIEQRVLIPDTADRNMLGFN